MSETAQVQFTVYFTECHWKRAANHIPVPVLVPRGGGHVPQHVPELLHLGRQLPDLVLLQHCQRHQLPRRQHVREAAAGHLGEQREALAPHPEGQGGVQDGGGLGGVGGGGGRGGGGGGVFVLLCGRRGRGEVLRFRLLPSGGGGRLVSGVPGFPGGFRLVGICRWIDSNLKKKMTMRLNIVFPLLRSGSSGSTRSGLRIMGGFYIEV